MRLKRPRPQPRNARWVQMGQGVFWAVYGGIHVVVDVSQDKVDWRAVIDVVMVIFGLALFMFFYLSPVQVEQPHD